jgi:hypothetical protein
MSWCQSKLKTVPPAATGSGGGGGGAAETSFNLNENNDDYSIQSNTTTTTNTPEEDEPHNQLDESNINQSLIESKILKQVKQHLNSENKSSLE